MELTLTSKHELLGDGYFLGLENENESEQLIVNIEPVELLNKWAYIEFITDTSDKYTTQRLGIVNNQVVYDIPNGLLQEGYVKVQLVFRDENSFVWKSFQRKFVVSNSINASDNLPNEYPDFISEAQKLLDEISIDADKVDEVLATEQSRVEAEAIRVSNENARITSENERKSAETTRLDKEVERIANEATRQSNEVSRVNAETQREIKFNTWENTLGVLDNLSNALKNTASGEVIRVDDVSPVEHNAKVKVSGKNLLSLLKEPDIQDTYRSWLVNPNGKTLTLSITDNDTSIDISGIYLGFSSSGKNGIDGTRWLVEGGEIKKRSYTTSDYKYVSIYGATDEIVNSLTSRFKIQLEEGDTATEYTPYVDPTSVTVTRCGKNLFDMSKLLAGAGWAENNGVYSGNPATLYDIYKPSNKTSLVNGFKKGTRYTLSLNGYVNAETETIGITMCFVYDDGSTDYLYVKDITSKKYTLTSAEGKNVVALYSSYGNPVTSYLSKVQIEEGTIATNYEPYKSETYTPSTDGSLTITSAAPTMTLLTDKDVNIEVEYNQDINKVIKSLQDKINALTK